MNKPIFIIGLHRTGSTLINNMFDLSSEVAMAPDEMHFSTPWHRDFLYYARKAGNLKKDEILSIFLRIVFSDTPYGSAWKKLACSKINRRQLFDRILRSSRSPKDILTLILEEYAKSRGKKRFGVKYPVHFSRLKILFEWWPDCKVIHLVRDPRAICASKVNDNATKSRKNRHELLSPLIHLGTQLFFALEFIWSSRIHIQHKDNSNYLKIRLEDILANPAHYIQKMCRFCELEYEPVMMYPFGKPSSYDGKKRQGFDQKIAFRWKTTLSPLEVKWITWLTQRGMKRLGYGRIEQEYEEWLNSTNSVEMTNDKYNCNS